MRRRVFAAAEISVVLRAGEPAHSSQGILRQMLAALVNLENDFCSAHFLCDFPTISPRSPHDLSKVYSSGIAEGCVIGGELVVVAYGY